MTCLMKEWPTRVRTGVPPCSATISGTAREVIRLWITVAPGCLASSRTATSAVIADGRLQVDEVRRLQRVGLVVRERPVQLEVQGDDVQRQSGQQCVTED